MTEKVRDWGWELEEEIGSKRWSDGRNIKVEADELAVEFSDSEVEIIEN
jgi:hypothetical protein